MMSRSVLFFSLIFSTNTLFAYATTDQVVTQENTSQQMASWDWYICTQEGIAGGLHAGVASYLCGGQAWAHYTDKLFENRTLSASMTVDECADALFEIVPENELENSCYDLMERSQMAEFEGDDSYSSI